MKICLILASQKSSFSVFLSLSKLTQFDRTETTISLCDIEGAPFAAQSIVSHLVTNIISSFDSAPIRICKRKQNQPKPMSINGMNNLHSYNFKTFQVHSNLAIVFLVYSLGNSEIS